MAIRLGEVRQIVCASPDYLARRGVPGEPVDLSGHSCIATGADGKQELWKFRRHAVGARVRAVRVHTALSITSVEAGLDSALCGRGLVRALSYQVAEQLKPGWLQRVLVQFEPQAIPVNLVFRPNSQRQSPIRGFVDHAVPALRRELAQVAATVGQPPGP